MSGTHSANSSSSALLFTYIGQSLLGLPVAALLVAASLRGIDETLLKAAVSLGARDWQVFLNVVLPLSLHGVLSTLGLSFLIAFDEVLVAIFVRLTQIRERSPRYSLPLIFGK
ncbi:ABC transporter permease [Aliirhizobium smilacinae]|uniref:ABC transporter permease n=1 Tax=Aliirhizobium smilacinae TaxID=1395944 RepID=UPI0015D59326|nr:ABC transporter permease subunit [Rhizobium smilacinae]